MTSFCVNLSRFCRKKRFLDLEEVVGWIQYDHHNSFYKLAQYAPIPAMGIEKTYLEYIFLLTKNANKPVKIHYCHFEAPVSEDGVIF